MEKSGGVNRLRTFQPASLNHLTRTQRELCLPSCASFSLASKIAPSGMTNWPCSPLTAPFKIGSPPLRTITQSPTRHSSGWSHWQDGGETDTAQSFVPKHSTVKGNRNSAEHCPNTRSKTGPDRGRAGLHGRGFWVLYPRKARADHGGGLGDGGISPRPPLVSGGGRSGLQEAPPISNRGARLSGCGKVPRIKDSHLTSSADHMHFARSTRKNA